MYPRLGSFVATAGNPLALCDVGHQGLFWEREFHKYNNRMRIYDPQGRFLQHDPMEYVDGMNMYEYVGSCPTIFLDPEGLWSFWDWWNMGDGNASEDAQKWASQRREKMNKLATEKKCWGKSEKGKYLQRLMNEEQQMADNLHSEILKKHQQGSYEGMMDGLEMAANSYSMGITDAVGLTDASRLSNKNGWYKAANISSQISAAAFYTAVGLKGYEKSTGIRFELHGTHSGRVPPHIQAIKRLPRNYRGYTKWRFPPH